MEFVEIFDRDRLKFILDNFDYFSNKIGTFKDVHNNYKEITNKKTIFTILKNLLHSKSTIYNYSKKDIRKKGRLFGCNSLQSVNKIVRHTLCKDLCIDIDIVNAHNVFLQHYCIKNNIDIRWLVFYNENRDELLIELMFIFSIDRETAKKICLEIINGGGDIWFKQIEIPPPNWLQEFLREVKTIHKKIAKLEPERFKKSKIDNPLNPYGTCLNTLLCEMENYVLSFMIEYCNLKNIKISTLCFDGVLIEKCNLNISEMKTFVSNHSGINIDLSIKEMNQFISLDIETNFTKSDEIYVNPDIFNCNEKVVIVKAGLGTGKTTATISYINANKDTFKKIIVCTPRITFAKSIHDRLNNETIYNDWVLYNDKSLDFYIDKNHVVVQCESLHRCSNLFLNETLIIIDEIESFLTSLTSKKTHRNHEYTLELFEFLLYSKKIICLDAFISDKTLNIFNSLDIPFFYIHYPKKLKERQYIQINKEEKGEDIFQKWADYIINEIYNGKKMYLFISSKNKLLDFKHQLELKLPYIKLLYYTSDHKETLENVNELWSSVDVILTTITLSVGVNYDIRDYFHKLGVYLSANSKNLVRDVFQSLYRIRHLIDNELIFALNTSHYGMNYNSHPTYASEIEKRIDAENSLYIRTYENIHKTKHPSNNKFIWLKNLIIDNILESNCSIIDLENVFFQYLNECNYVESDIMNNDIETFITDDELNSTSYKYDSIPSISINEMKEIRKQNIKSELDNLKLEKFFFQQSVIDIEDKKDESVMWGLYCDYGRNKFRNLRYEKGIINETLNLSQVINNTLPLIAEKMGIQLIKIKQISSWFNLDHSQDIDKIIPNNVLKKLIPLFKENIKDIYTAFNLRETRSKSNLKDEWTIRKITTITNSVLDKWGYTKIKKRSRKQTGKDGERVDVSDYQLQNTPLAGKVNIFKNIKQKVSKSG